MKLWKIQKFAGDAVYDLRQKGMLPIVILLLVAMVAVPLLITSGGSESSSSTNQAALQAAAKVAPENEKAVVAYTPGLRDYKERLKSLSPKDPFKQQFTQAAAQASQLSASLSATSPATSTDTGSGTLESTGDAGTKTTTDTGGAPNGGGGGGNSGQTRIRYYYYFTTDLEVGEAAWTLQRRNSVSALTSLPSETVPVVVYLGATIDGKRAMFLVSNQVSQVTGQGECLPSPTDCSLLALRRDQSEDLLYGLDGKTYRIKVIRNRRVVSSKPPQG